MRWSHWNPWQPLPVQPAPLNFPAGIYVRRITRRHRKILDLRTILKTERFILRNPFTPFPKNNITN